MSNFLKKSITLGFSFTTIVFTFVPESFFEKVILPFCIPEKYIILLNHIFLFIGATVLAMILNALYLCWRRSVTLKGKNYCIKVKYGNILRYGNILKYIPIFGKRIYKKVIPFDECFTTKVGTAPSDIKPTSICGQYLKANPMSEQDMQNLISRAQLKAAKDRSKFQNKERYESGTVVPNGNYLLMAFAKLDSSGLGIMNRDEYLDCLRKLWIELDKHYGQNDVCIPILGSGITRMNGESLTQQELLDIIIASYKLSVHKLKSPHKIHIVCRRCDGFSLNRIGENL